MLINVVEQIVSDIFKDGCADLRPWRERKTLSSQSGRRRSTGAPTSVRMSDAGSVRPVSCDVTTPTSGKT